MLQRMLQIALSGLLGLAGWPLLEYAVHGVLSHRVHGPIAHMHGSHHADPRRVRTPASAWVPAALLLFGVLCWPLGAARAGALVLGLVLGFVRYERTHHRLHFAQLRSARELQLRQHHLAHHLCNGQAYFGVTQRWTDRLFGSLPPGWRTDYARVADASPLARSLAR